jgi:predicted TPR repeat methyltransferase
MSQTSSDALAERVDRMIHIGRIGAARPLVAALRRMGLAPARLDLLEAKLALREGRITDALSGLDRAIAIESTDAGLRKCRAEARLKADNLTGAADDAAESVILDRHDPAGKALLGIVLIEMHQYDDARSCLAEAVAADPHHPSYRVALAEALSRLGRSSEAEATLAQAIAYHPSRADLRAKAILLQMRLRNFQGAITLAQDAKSVGAADACVFGLLGHALSSLGQHSIAADAYQDALKLCPEDSYVRHLVAASGGMPSADRAPPEYLRAVFNSYADRFEPHLITLLYRVPGLIRSIMIPELSKSDSPALLDLGCGTGLVAVTCSDLKLGPITGVDISAAMLEKAREKRVYAELIEADLPQFLDADPRSWPLVTAGDVFCYFGDLGGIFAKLRSHLVADGLFIFSVEELLPDADGIEQGGGDYSLGRLGRYAHSIEHIKSAAKSAGFQIEQIMREDLRQESDNPVSGLVVVLRANFHA